MNLDPGLPLDLGRVGKWDRSKGQSAHLWANTGVVDRGVESTTGDLSV